MDSVHDASGWMPAGEAEAAAVCVVFEDDFLSQAYVWTPYNENTKTEALAMI